MYVQKEYKDYIFKFFISQRKNKKYRVDIYKNNKFIKTVYFGDRRYQHYYDQIGMYSELNHGDMKRLQAYYKRHKKPYTELSSSFFSSKYLW